ncbi:MAG TPA: hypothetical protein VGP97_24365 [Burkholderiales bacterium]|nr:hypothetical protein [Burkholderiales bacterium]
MHKHETKAQGIDLEAAEALIAALQRDLAKVSAGSADLQILEGEVEALRNVLVSPRPKRRRVKEALHDIRAALEHALETVEGEAIRDWPYIAEIGRILGMR